MAADSLRDDSGRCRACAAPEAAQCSEGCLARLAYDRGYAAGLDAAATLALKTTPLSSPDRRAVRDTQVGGSHYVGQKIQPWDVVDEYNLDYYRASVLKYLLRAGRKTKVAALQDLEKAAHFLAKAIEREKAKSV